jgi:hypothetical protein
MQLYGSGAQAQLNFNREYKIWGNTKLIQNLEFETA